MNKIMAHQQNLQSAISMKHLTFDPNNCKDASKGIIADFIRSQLFFMHSECTELLEAIGTKAINKPWSTKYIGVYMSTFESTDKIKSEAIDMLCFCLNICMAAGLTADNINEEYNKVLDKNLKRLMEDY